MPIYIEYRLVPGATAPTPTNITWAAAIHATVSISELDVFENGSTFGGDTAWKVSAECKVNDVSLGSSDVWSQTAVGQNGSTVNPDGVTPPQDPQKKTSTYARYAGLTWSKTNIALAKGNKLQCVLTGARTDKNPAVQLPPIPLTINSVDPAKPVDAWAGNYDSNTSLDYVVHYTITFQ